jgi:hypothetical protein
VAIDDRLEDSSENVDFRSVTLRGCVTHLRNHQTYILMPKSIQKKVSRESETATKVQVLLLPLALSAHS